MIVVSFWPTRMLLCAALSFILSALPLLILVPFGFGSEPSPVVVSAGTRPAPRHEAAKRPNARFPLHFIENRGQVDSRAAYYIHGTDKAFYFGPEGVTMVLSKAVAGPAAQPSVRTISLGPEESAGGVAGVSITRTAVKLEFIGANSSSRPVGAELAPARFSYFRGAPENWTVGLRTYQKLVYTDLWPGIDLIYTASSDRLKYMFVVKPGADPKRIRFRYRGAEAVSLDDEGKLRVRTVLDDFHDDKPTAHQEIDGRAVDVGARYALLPGTADDGHAYGFAVGAYDSTNVLVIDPAILVYAGFIGGTGDDRGNAIAVDVNGNAYITGETNSLQSSFPVAGGLDVGQNGGVDAFVAKVDPTGTRLLYAGFIGGAGDDRGKSIAVDSLGNAYITGETSSDQTSFPVNVGPDVTYNGGIDAFVAKINAAGTNLVYAGYIGGFNSDRGMGIAIDSSNRAYVTGETASGGASFPNGGGFGALASFDSSQNGGLDAFVARVAANGASLEYAGYIGGVGSDRGTSIAVDGSNRAYVTGETNSSSASFPNGSGFAGLTSFDSSINGDFDAFVARVAADGLSLNYAGYVGGSLADRGNGIVVDGDGNAYITGETSSGAHSFPAGNGLGGLPGPGQVQRGGVDAFVAKINAAGTNLVYAGYIGGDADDRGNAIALVPGCVNNCAVYVAGETSSNQSSFPVSVGPDSTYNGGVDAFVAKINGDGTLGLVGYLGGAGDDRGKGIALDAIGDVYLTGETNSAGTSFPVRGPLDRTQNSGLDGFVAKICVTTCADVSLTVSDSPDPVTVNTSVTYLITVTNHGPDTATAVEMVDILPNAVGLDSVTPSVGSCSGTSPIVCDLGDLANGTSAIVTIVVTPTATGKLTNLATVSADVTDTDPSNNSVRQQTTVTLPDLLIKSLRAVTAAIPGSDIVVTDTTINRGKVAAGASTTSFYLSADPKLDAGDLLLGSRIPDIPALAPKESNTGSTTLTIPLATALGRYFLIAVADAAGSIDETKEKNAKVRPLTVTLPDMIAQSLRVPSSAAAGASVVVSDTTSNKAPVDAGASTTQYYLSADVILDGSDVLLGSRIVPALGAKGRSAGSAPVTIPLATPPGKYFLLAVADGVAEVTEADENNNLRARPITITP